MDNGQKNDYDRQSRLAPQDEAIMMSSIAMDKRDVITNGSTQPVSTPPPSLSSTPQKMSYMEENLKKIAMPKKIEF
eukprot:CAMPEP_0113455850 /NCGR_PEP_ID=MMETSP0014_2-20120614/8585_1 /TAXON_ID=2857 /ORGANISM="Nitzschia sp." /LENGTH=75 /DNA_ID=CAMNT_0000347287 /DNA_START=31 /DNA_END=258 /DNA_ORIENTATION=+ /assembly_acc=CAM_ASM_000159